MTGIASEIHALSFSQYFTTSTIPFKSVIKLCSIFHSCISKNLGSFSMSSDAKIMAFFFKKKPIQHLISAALSGFLIQYQCMVQKVFLFLSSSLQHLCFCAMMKSLYYNLNFGYYTLIFQAICYNQILCSSIHLHLLPLQYWQQCLGQ